ncbi:zinc-activated ligand-gated ion channel isoform X2 [Danio aesculapii]|uniref:zinc-activated ligand-gated ion channel isoform X2 n=1 Tax=Danio aesculapii TaxID=1142201 RepID=UPI0024BFCF7B|nr:zinc-activated ligand-gated ion channel isoform X2 [Danio aesculapii]
MLLQRMFALLFLISSSPIVLTDWCEGSYRCLANYIVAKNIKTPPQEIGCFFSVIITSLQYETLSFDTKDLQMSSRVKINMRWTDLALQWTEETSVAREIILPVDKIWTPGLVLDNAIDATTKPYTDDVVVSSDGTVNHAVILLIAVNCDIKLFTYPFVSGQCLVAINGWRNGDCGIILQYPRSVTTLGGSLSGEWMTEKVEIAKESDMENRKYLLVTLSINPFSAVVTLILPSALIMLADLVSFSLPVQGGERNNLKVTLVLSFTMFLFILNDRLASGGECTPLLHYHFCFCLVNLVLSMVMSLVLTHLTTADNFLTFKCLKRFRRQNIHLEQREDAGMKKQSSGSAKASLQKIVNFLENVEQKEQVANSNEAFVNYLDKFCFCFFLFIDILYLVIIAIVTRTNLCTTQKIKIWDYEPIFIVGEPEYPHNGTEYVDY